MKKMLFISTICAMSMMCGCSCSKEPARTADSSPCSSDAPQQADWKITAAVKKKLSTDSSLSSGARMISVTTNNGVVTLSGTVTDSNERNKVMRMVKAVPGVTSVDDDQLTISNP
jgi:hyperosmotically inducible protein